MIARRIYWVLLVISIGIGLYFYGIAPNDYSPNFLVFFSLVPFLMFAGSVHGLIAHLLKSDVKGGMLLYPLAMGALFTALLLIHIFVIIPIICPNFLN